jgi:hypothetical protein
MKINSKILNEAREIPAQHLALIYSCLTRAPYNTLIKNTLNPLIHPAARRLSIDVLLSRQQN